MKRSGAAGSTKQDPNHTAPKTVRCKGRAGCTDPAGRDQRNPELGDTNSMSASAPSRCTRGYNNTDTLVKVESPRTVRGRLSGVGDGRPVGASAVGDVQNPLSLRFSDAIWIQRSH